MNRTVYSVKKEKDYVIETLLSIDQYKRILKQIKGLKIKLDENQFCRKCSPNIKDPQLVLNIKYDKEESHQVKNFTLEDLKKLSEFTKGEVVYKDERGGESLIKANSARLKELLGLETEK